MQGRNLWFVPVALGLLFPCTFIITYVAAYLQGHLTSSLTLISDAASRPPQSCFFAQMLNLAAAITAPSVYLRYTELHSGKVEHRPPRLLLRLFLVSGILAALGVSLVGNFQFEHAPVMHGLGALLCFGVGTVCLWTQVVCTKYDPPERACGCILWLRFALALLCSTFFLLTLIGSAAAWIQRGGRKTAENYHEGYAWFLLGSASEWAMAFSMSAFIASFAREARYYTITLPSAQMRDESSITVNQERWQPTVLHTI